MARGESSSGSVQFMSDLHLEATGNYATFDFPVTAPYLLLSGDVGSLADYKEYLSFIRRQTGRYAAVLLVLGNHEFHGLDHSTTLARAKELEAEPSLGGRLHVLHRRRFDIPGTNTTIIGCTLWTMVPEEAKEAVVGRVKDFQHIEDWGVETHNGAHVADLKWLKGQLREVPEETRVIVATHHAPSLEGTSEPQHRGSPWSSAFATGIMEDGEDWSRVGCWVFGHTHYSTDVVVEGVRIVSNQRGYVGPGRVIKEGFEPGRLIEM
ncbi:hypothetical protein CH063_12974 [Colletotrichum higginsianum]|uniref:Calcineurin-like phosphoesterase domain-containing protein n=3 Tax=Colletotrichum higginsianum TaxID=80884 RepID=H1VSK3_COLHI|nr:Uncharacterized protein CH35J_004342 [Colletotrichum higginsianum]CCF43211.1 hypothetical protein CH063_12974 [Colletotrichum higginsianum]